MLTFGLQTNTIHNEVDWTAWTMDTPDTSMYRALTRIYGVCFTPQPTMGTCAQPQEERK